MSLKGHYQKQVTGEGIHCNHPHPPAKILNYPNPRPTLYINIYHPKRLVVLDIGFFCKLRFVVEIIISTGCFT